MTTVRHAGRAIRHIVDKLPATLLSLGVSGLAVAGVLLFMRQAPAQGAWYRPVEATGRISEAGNLILTQPHPPAPSPERTACSGEGGQLLPSPDDVCVSSGEGLGVRQLEPLSNLLVNPDFEDGYSYPIPCCNNIAVPVGWNIRWYTDTPPVGDPQYKFKQPEVKIIDATVWPFCCQLLLPPRIHTGRYAIESFTLFANQDTSFYQQVGDIPIGAVVTASAWTHVWLSSCDPTASFSPVVSLQGPKQAGCPDNYWPVESNRMMVGIDPFGGVDPRAASVVWNWDPGAPQWWGPYDYYSSTLPVVTYARAHTVTMFLRAVSTTPAKHDNVYFDTTSLTYTFPISVHVDQGQPWPLPGWMTVSIQAPVSFTQVDVDLTAPGGADVPVTFVDTTGVSPTYLSRWRFSPPAAGNHVFMLLADELPDPLVQALNVEPLHVDVEADRLPPASGSPVTDSAQVTLILYSPISLTNATATVTDPLASQLPITFLSTGYVDPDYVFRWLFASPQAGWHTYHVAADEFAQPLIQSFFLPAARIYLPVVLRNAP